MRRIVCALAFALPAAAFADGGAPVEQPVLKAGDTWTYRNTDEKGEKGFTQSEDAIKVERVTASAIYYSSRRGGPDQAAREILGSPDWARIRDVNGKQTVVNRPMAFPLESGKSWDVEFRENHPNKAHNFEHWKNHYTVIGLESIEVPAGKFNALKIEAEGSWEAEMAPTQTLVQGGSSAPGDTATVQQVHTTQASMVSGRVYRAIWYVPEVRRWVKSVEEYYSSGGIRNERYTAELESYKVGP